MNFRNRILQKEFLTRLGARETALFTEASPQPFSNPRFRAAFSAQGYLASYLQNLRIAGTFSRKCFTLHEFRRHAHYVC